MATYIGQVALGGETLPVASTLYGTCATAAGTAEKAVTCTNFNKLITGVTIFVKFTNSNTASTSTLNVNSTGAKAIKRYGTTAPSTSVATSWQAGSVVAFTYDGSYWQMVGWLNTDTDIAWDNTNKKLTKTINGTTSDVVTASTLKTDLGLSNAMLFMGSLGTGGTITSLPAAVTSNQGYTYKVITTGTYANQAAKIGDAFISNGTEWVLIPSGDETAVQIVRW